MLYTLYQESLIKCLVILMALAANTSVVQAFPLPNFGASISSQILPTHPDLNEIYNKLQKASQSDANILIVGETGTGVGTLARQIHQASLRADQPFVEVSISGLNSGLLDSELFGHVKGAFTGADTDRRGLFEHASGGTLYLPGIEDLPPSTQAKVLRVLEGRTVRKVGSSLDTPVDFRLITSINADPEPLVKNGTLRDDLYHRIDTFQFRLPPLRELKPFLGDFYRETVEELKLNLSPKPSEPLLSKMLEYGWPQNLLELQQLLEQAAIADAPEAFLLAKLDEKIARQHRARTEAHTAAAEADKTRAMQALALLGCGKIMKMIGSDPNTVASRLRVPVDMIPLLFQTAQELTNDTLPTGLKRRSKPKKAGRG